MKNDLSKDYFDCPNCGVKNVIYKKESVAAEYVESVSDDDSHPLIEDEWVHYLVRCTRDLCNRLTYIKVNERYSYPGSNWKQRDERKVDIQYPSANSELPDYVPGNIRKHYKETVDAYNFDLKTSASIICRKVIYEICDKQNVEGNDYKEKIINLGFDKRITDPLLNIKNIGDETVHANGWDSISIEKAIDALGIIIDMIYTQENRIKSFSKHYSIENQNRKK